MKSYLLKVEDEDLWRKLKHYCTDHDLTVKEAILEAIITMVSGGYVYTPDKERGE